MTGINIWPKKMFLSIDYITVWPYWFKIASSFIFCLNLWSELVIRSHRLCVSLRPRLLVIDSLSNRKSNHTYLPLCSQIDGNGSSKHILLGIWIMICYSEFVSNVSHWSKIIFPSKLYESSSMKLKSIDCFLFPNLYYFELQKFIIIGEKCCLSVQSIDQNKSKTETQFYNKLNNKLNILQSFWVLVNL